MSQEPEDQRNQSDQREPVASSPPSVAGGHVSTGHVPGERTLVEGLLYYIGIVWHYRWFIFIVSALAAIGSVAFAIVSLRLPPERSPLPNVYQANAVLLQQRAGSTQSVSATIMASLGMEAAAGGLDYGQIALAVLNSRDFVDRIVEQNDVIARYQIAQNVRTVSRRIVLSSATFGFDPRTGMLQIVYQDIDPVFAARMVGSVVTELIAWFASRGGSDRLLAVQTMEDKLQEVGGRIREIESEIEQFQQRYGVLRVEEIAQTQTDLLSGLQAQLLALDLQISNQEEVSRIPNDPELLSLRAQRQSVLNLMDRIRSGYTGGGEMLPPRDQLPALAAEYSRLQMDLEIQGRIYQALTERYEVARLTADTDPAFTILVPVEVPEEKSGPRRSELVMMVTAGGFFGSVFVALSLHWAVAIIRDPKKRQLLAQAGKRDQR